MVLTPFRKLQAGLPEAWWNEWLTIDPGGKSMLIHLPECCLSSINSCESEFVRMIYYE
jgi:hypothetical protein